MRVCYREAPRTLITRRSCTAAQITRNGTVVRDTSRHSSTPNCRACAAVAQHRGPPWQSCARRRERRRQPTVALRQATPKSEAVQLRRADAGAIQLNAKPQSSLRVQETVQMPERSRHRVASRAGAGACTPVQHACRAGYAWCREREMATASAQERPTTPRSSRAAAGASSTHKRTAAGPTAARHGANLRRFAGRRAPWRRWHEQSRGAELRACCLAAPRSKAQRAAAASVDALVMLPWPRRPALAAPSRAGGRSSRGHRSTARGPCAQAARDAAPSAARARP